MGVMDTSQEVRIGKRVLRKGKRKPNALVIDRAASNGIIHKSSISQLHEARRLYVIEGYTVKSISVRLGTPIQVLDRWILLFGWDAERQERINKLYIKHGNRIRKIADSLGIKADEIANSLMSTLHDKALDIRQNPDSTDGRELTNLVKALKDMFSLRKEIHSSDKSKVDVVDQGTITESLQHILSNALIPSHTVQQITDADYDILDDTSK